MRVPVLTHTLPILLTNKFLLKCAAIGFAYIFFIAMVRL